MTPSLVAAVCRAAPQLAAAEAVAEQKQVPALQLRRRQRGWRPAELAAKCAVKSTCSACWPQYPFCRVTLRLQLMTSGRSMQQQQWATRPASTRCAAPAVPAVPVVLLRPLGLSCCCACCAAVPTVQVLLLSRSFASCMRKTSHAACAFDPTHQALLLQHATENYAA